MYLNVIFHHHFSSYTWPLYMWKMSICALLLAIVCVNMLCCATDHINIWHVYGIICEIYNTNIPHSVLGTWRYASWRFWHHDAPWCAAFLPKASQDPKRIEISIKTYGISNLDGTVTRYDVAFPVRSHHCVHSHKSAASAKMQWKIPYTDACSHVCSQVKTWNQDCVPVQRLVPGRLSTSVSLAQALPCHAHSE